MLGQDEPMSSARVLPCGKAKQISEKDTDVSKGPRNQSEGALSGQIWDKLSFEKNKSNLVLVLDYNLALTIINNNL